MQPMASIALRAARDAGALIVRAGDRLDLVTVEEKQVNDFVTEVDRLSEAEIISQLRKVYPDHGFIGEESGEHEGAGEYVWIIDPLDGTTNFIHGIPHYAVSIGCLRNGKPEHAVVYNPITHEEFVASRGDGATLNGRRIRVTKREGKDGLDGALLGTGIPFRHHEQEKLEPYLKALGELAKQTAGIRRQGSAALDLAYVAAGRYDAFWETGLQSWDMAAGVLLVQEAGGLISDFNGGNNYLESGNVVCGTPKVFKEVLKVVGRYFQ